MAYHVHRTALPEVLVLEPEVFCDARGRFFESFNRRHFAAATGLDLEFVQDNQSRSSKGVLRGLHYQIEHAQGKLVRVLEGEILDFAVDLRKCSPNFGRWAGATLSAGNLHQMWVPEGFAHGFVVLSDFAEVAYKATDYWHREHERCIRWNDPDIGIDWQYVGNPVLNEKDQNGDAFKNARVYE